MGGAMEGLVVWEQLAVLVGTMGLTLVLTPLALRIALRRQILDHPSEIKAQTSPVPYLGGAAIVCAFVVVVMGAAALRPPTSGLDQLAVILGLGLLLAATGLLDDLVGMSPWLRLAIEVGVGLAVWATPAGADLFQNDALNAVVSVVWIVAVTNALNLLDNMDGLSAGVSGIAAVGLFFVAEANGQFLVSTLALALAGCAAGFLRSNFHPARIYMGDAGALFLGFLLAVLTMKVDDVEAPPLLALTVPIVLLGVPLFDTLLVTVNRLIHRRSPLSGGRDHVSHRLVFVGVPVPAAVTVIYVAAMSLGLLAVVIARVDEPTALLLLAWLLGMAALFGVLLSRVPVYDTSRRRHLMLQEVRAHEREPLAAPGRDPEDDVTAG